MPKTEEFIANLEHQTVFGPNGAIPDNVTIPPETLEAIRKQFGSKASRTHDVIGCTVAELSQHLQIQFTDGMTWDNYGRNGWHVDHVRPCASFDLTDPDQQRQCFHYTNLQPLWAVDNIRKGSKWDGR